MASGELQIVSNENGEREIESERETAYLLRPDTMRNRLLAAKQRQDRVPFEVRSLEFDSAAFEDLAWWVEQDRAQALG